MTGLSFAARSPAMSNTSSPKPVHVIGGGMAGSEAAWQIANAGVPVILHEMRRDESAADGETVQVRTDAHQTDGLAELVCSNSFRSDDGNTMPSACCTKRCAS